MKKRKQFIV